MNSPQPVDFLSRWRPGLIQMCGEVHRGPWHLHERRLLMGCFGKDVCSLEHGCAPEAEAKTSSAAATPVIAVPLRRQQTAADYMIGLAWKNLGSGGVSVIILLFTLDILYLSSNNCV